MGGEWRKRARDRGEWEGSGERERGIGWSGRGVEKESEG